MTQHAKVLARCLGADTHGWYCLDTMVLADGQDGGPALVDMDTTAGTGGLRGTKHQLGWTVSIIDTG